MENKELNESLKRYKELLGYDLKKGASSLTERRHVPYTDYAEDTEGGDEGGNEDFDFGGDQGGDNKEGGNEDFDFGGDTEGGDAGGNEDFDFGGEDLGGEEEEVDEFGTILTESNSIVKLMGIIEWKTLVALLVLSSSENLGNIQFKNQYPNNVEMCILGGN